MKSLHQFSGNVRLDKAATCTESGVVYHICDLCNYEEEEQISPLGHEYSALYTAPTCTESGYTTYTCSVCGKVLVAQVVIPKLGGIPSDNTYNSDLNDFWREVEEDIEEAKAGETVEVELGNTDKMVWFIIDVLRSNPDVGIKLTRNGKVVVEIPAGMAVANESSRSGAKGIVVGIGGFYSNCILGNNCKSVNFMRLSAKT